MVLDQTNVTSKPLGADDMLALHRCFRVSNLGTEAANRFEPLAKLKNAIKAAAQKVT